MPPSRAPSVVLAAKFTHVLSADVYEMTGVYREVLPSPPLVNGSEGAGHLVNAVFTSCFLT